MNCRSFLDHVLHYLPRSRKGGLVIVGSIMLPWDGCPKSGARAPRTALTASLSIHHPSIPHPRLNPTHPPSTAQRRRPGTLSFDYCLVGELYTCILLCSLVTRHPHPRRACTSL